MGAAYPNPRRSTTDIKQSMGKPPQMRREGKHPVKTILQWEVAISHVLNQSKLKYIFDPDGVLLVWVHREALKLKENSHQEESDHQYARIAS